LHVRLPAPLETVLKVEPDLVRVARVGLSAPLSGERGAVAWSATHGARRGESALFFTGDENLVELSGVVEYRLTADGVRDALFGVVSVDAGVGAAAEGVFREEIGRSALEDVLAERRGAFETEVEGRLRSRLAATGISVKVDRVRIVDAHPPREVVPAYRDVSAAVSDAERYRNEAEAYAAGRHWSALGDAAARRDEAAARSHGLQARADGDRQAFLARAAARAARPDLTEFRLLWDTLAATYAGRPKLLLDPRAGGRRHVWLADPERMGLAPARAIGADSAPTVAPED
jgi:regulator of protease activity HflC (stomatin/prohibitin superfamily)